MQIMKISERKLYNENAGKNVEYVTKMLLFFMLVKNLLQLIIFQN